jgi:hypothetical protein
VFCASRLVSQGVVVKVVERVVTKKGVDEAKVKELEDSSQRAKKYVNVASIVVLCVYVCVCVCVCVCVFCLTVLCTASPWLFVH